MRGLTWVFLALLAAAYVYAFDSMRGPGPHAHDRRALRRLRRRGLRPDQACETAFVFLAPTAVVARELERHLAGQAYAVTVTDEAAEERIAAAEAGEVLDSKTLARLGQRHRLVATQMLILDRRSLLEHGAICEAAATACGAGYTGWAAVLPDPVPVAAA